MAETYIDNLIVLELEKISHLRLQHFSELKLFEILWKLETIKKTDKFRRQFLQKVLSMKTNFK